MTNNEPKENITEDYLKEAQIQLDGLTSEQIVSKVAELLKENKSLNEENNILAEKLGEDSLTGLLNRDGLKKKFYETKSTLERAVGELRQTGQLRDPDTLGFRGYTVLWIDIVGLKKFNDEVSFKEGDKKIKTTADIINAAGQRTLDLKARFGGDDFIMILMNQDPAQAMNIINKMQDLAKEKNIQLSIGVAGFSPEDNLEDSLEITSNAMTNAKKLGKQDENFRTLGIGVFVIEKDVV